MRGSPHAWRNSEGGKAYTTWAQSLSDAADSMIGEDDLRVDELSEPALFDADTWEYHPALTPKKRHRGGEPRNGQCTNPQGSGRLQSPSFSIN